MQHTLSDLLMGEASEGGKDKRERGGNRKKGLRVYHDRSSKRKEESQRRGGNTKVTN